MSEAKNGPEYADNFGALVRDTLITANDPRFINNLTGKLAQEIIDAATSSVFLIRLRERVRISILQATTVEGGYKVRREDREGN